MICRPLPAPLSNSTAKIAAMLCDGRIGTIGQRERQVEYLFSRASLLASQASLLCSRASLLAPVNSLLRLAGIPRRRRAFLSFSCKFRIVPAAPAGSDEKIPCQQGSCA